MVLPATPEQLAAEPALEKEAAAAAARPRIGHWLEAALIVLLLPTLLPLMCVILAVEAARSRMHYASAARQQRDVTWLESWEKKAAEVVTATSAAAVQELRQLAPHGSLLSGLHHISPSEDVEVEVNRGTKVGGHM